LEIDGEVAAGRFQFRWQYSANVHRPETVEILARGFVQALCELIAHCQTPEAGGVTPSDFPLAGLNQEQLNKLGKLIG
jgi:non-ribosomal peptide synthase protein (TIGR01720 family)